MTATISAPGSVAPPSAPNPTAGGAASPKAREKTEHALIANRNGIIDGYRGLAAIGVVLGHTVLINQLIFQTSARNAIFSFFDSLPFFFAVSGLMNYRRFVIGAMNGRVPRRAPIISSRLWRILPVYFLIVMVVWAMRFANSPADWSDLALHLTLLQTWSPTYVFWLDGPSWFLANDLQFFLLTALLAPFVTQLALRIALTRTGTFRRMAVMMAFPVLLLIASGLDIYWTQLHNHDTAIWVRYTPIYTLGEYAVGMILAVVMFSPGMSRPRPRLAVVLTVIGLAGTAVTNYFEWHKEWVYAFQYPMLACFLCIAVAGAIMTPPQSVFHRIMGIKPLQFLAGVGLTILLVQEPLELVLEHLGFINVFTTTACWASAGLLVLVSAAVAWVAAHAVEEPAMKLREKLMRLKALELGRDRRHRGPIPRMLPDVALELPGGAVASVRSALGDRPLLLAFGEAGAGALAEQRFRLDAGESTALHIAAAPDASATAARHLGAGVAFDRDGTLSRALNVPVALVEVDPDGLITSFQRSRREALGAWT